MKLEEVKTGYTKSAKKYDDLLSFWFGQILRIEKHRKQAVEWLELKEGDTVLDIGCGTGVNFPFIEQKIGSQGHIIGVDYTQAMLKQAQEKIKKNNWNNITLIQGDAVHINEIVSAKVDAVISTYCFSILYDIESALCNTLTLLKPNGNIVILDVKRIKPDNKFAKIIYPIYASVVKKYGISSDEDLDEKNAEKKWQLWQKITKQNLVNIKTKEFLLGMFFIFQGTKRIQQLQ